MALPPHPPGVVDAIREHREAGYQALLRATPALRTAHKERAKTTAEVPGNVAQTPMMCYVDSPDMDYGYWLQLLKNQNLAIGSYSGTKKVAIIGGGPSGCAAAFELARAGLTVQVFEQAALVGGRCDSVSFSPDTANIAEMGAMRFPGSEFILSYYLNYLNLQPGGIDALPAFPDPGVVKTWVCWGDKTQQWMGTTAPNGFETVYNGWVALATKGITQGGQYIDFEDPNVLAGWMRVGKLKADQTANAWQKYVTAFQAETFYSVLQKLFTGKLVSPISGKVCDIPAGKVWTFDDFDKFGTVGIGSGGFGALYPINFVEIWRLIINGLEHQQRFFSPGIRQVSIRLQQYATSTGRASFTMNTPIVKVTGSKSVGFTLTDKNNKTYPNFAAVIVATTTRSMEISTNLLQPNTSLISTPVRSAIRHTHVVSSVKVAARIKAFWKVGTGASLPRVMQCDTTPCQAYTLDYNQTLGGNATGVCFITYTWDDDAVKQQGIAPLGNPYAVDPKTLYAWLLDNMSKLSIMVTDPYTGQPTNWANLLQPYQPSGAGEAVRMIMWQSEPYFNGAFKLSEPGQDQYTHDMYWDFKKAGTGADTGVYVAGDCASWTSGWVEGGLQTGLNAACATLISVGGRVTELSSPYTSSPWTQRDLYKYFALPPFPPTTASAEVEPASSKKKPRAAVEAPEEDEPVLKKHTTEKKQAPAKGKKAAC